MVTDESRRRDTILVYGTAWCPDCARSKRFLDRRSLAYDWVDIEKVPEAVDIVRDLNDGLQVVPTIVLPSGKVLAEPSDRELAEALALNS